MPPHNPPCPTVPHPFRERMGKGHARPLPTLSHPPTYVGGDGKGSAVVRPPGSRPLPPAAGKGSAVAPIRARNDAREPSRGHQRGQAGHEQPPRGHDLTQHQEAA